MSKKSENKIIEIKNLHKIFGEKTVLKGIDLSISEGEVVVLLGPSGCGKSTLLRTLNGLEKIQEGEILLDGVNISDSSSDWTKNKAENRDGFSKL
jgi:ABC-type polar amino acid transport system, ATPase component